MFALLELLVILFIFALGTGMLVVVYLYLRDITQTTHAIRRNQPVQIFLRASRWIFPAVFLCHGP